MATLSFDHRIVNGVGAANFLNDVKVEIERFSLA
jgi:pyruvate dehydrogenase E2 component (dihydrolipoamide acetyltransferase)